jgi:NADH-quinone oxidoreductase subunit E
MTTAAATAAMPPLSPEFRAHLADHCTHYASRRVGLIWVMQQIQVHCGGWLPDEAIREASEITGVSIPEVEGVATFFNWFFREPVGREIVTVCDSLPCWIGGCEKLRDSCEKVLGIKPGQTTTDGAFTLLPIVCLGNCDKAPTMMIGEELYDCVTTESLPEIFERHRKNPTKQALSDPHTGGHH